MAGRAFFKDQEEPPHLALDNVLASDVGSYKCRVDFYKAPTQISEVGLDVIGESQSSLKYGSWFSSERNDMSESVHLKVTLINFIIMTSYQPS